MKNLLNQTYKKKIVLSKELIKKTGKFPRKKKLVLCHGVFDVVHPGHIHHLLYAKSKGDILAVSLTCDKYINKGIYRPHIPQNLRALNLAALDVVDYVIIDLNQKPLKNIDFIKPDLYAKGFEYSPKNINSSTSEEINAVKSYKGKMIFTPGDIVYSSSKILKNDQPDLKYEKLNLLMHRNNLSFKKIKNTLLQNKKIKVHIIGDTIVDTIVNTKLIGGQTKTPTLSVLEEKVTNFIGGAAIVASHMKSAGADVKFTTILGNDDLSKFVLKKLKKQQIQINAIIDKTRPTTNKKVIVSSGHRLIKVDKLDNQPISDDITNQIMKDIIKTKSDSIIFSDFRHGIFNNANIKKFTSKIKKNIFKVADSQVASRWGNICEFKKFDLICPNEKEVRFSLGDQDSSISSLSRELYNSNKYKYLLLKLGEKGVFCVNKYKKEYDEAFSIDSFVTNLVDPVGSGDAMLAYATISMLKSNNLIISSIIGSLAAACACENDGNISVEVRSIVEKINYLEKKIKN